MLSTQKDENLSIMMQQLQEAEELKDKVESQERINTEKLMFELAGRIEAHEKISNRLDEMAKTMEEKDIAMAIMADETDARDEIIKAKDQALKRLKQMIAGTTGELVEQMQMEISEKDKMIRQFSSQIDKLEKEKNNIIESKGDSSLGSSQLQSLNNEINELKEQLSKLHGEFSTSEDSRKSLQDQNEQLNSDLSRYKAEVDRVNNDLICERAKKEKFENQVDEIGKNLLDQLDSEKSRTQSFQELNSNLEIDKEVLHRKVDELSLELDAEKRKTESLQESNSNLVDDKDDLQCKVDDLTKELNVTLEESDTKKLLAHANEALLNPERSMSALESNNTI
jgi:chromosome segregation ATPase